MHIATLLFSSLIALAKVASAQPASGTQPAAAPNAEAELPIFTLEEALAYARQHQPSLQAAQARIEVARRGAMAVHSEWLPRLGAAAQIYYATMNNSSASQITVRPLDLPSVGGNHTSGPYSQMFASTLVGIGVRQTIYDFGRLAALSAAADAETAAARQRASAESLDVALQVESMFYAVLAAKAVSRAAEDAWKRAALRRDMVKAGVERGLRPPIDLTRAEADLTRFDVGRTRAGGAIQDAQALFAAALGAEATLVDARGEAPSEQELPPFGQALEDALARDPSLRASLARLAQQQSLTRATMREWAPNLMFTGTFSGRAGGAPTAGGPDGVSGWLPVVPNWDLGLIVTVPLFDGVILARRNQSRASEQVLRSEIDVQRRRLITDIQRTYSSFRVAKAALPALFASADAAQRNYDQANARFKAGLSTSVELADAETIRTDAEIQLAVGRFEVSRARAAYNRSIALGL